MEINISEDVSFARCNILEITKMFNSSRLNLFEIRGIRMMIRSVKYGAPTPLSLLEFSQWNLSLSPRIVFSPLVL